ncbi:MAG: hypothetical protein MSIBF_06395 [Candidatus Altiarchaeales archaeon IMC4]|nr:MAG: hypothetical protein MSIBF_06395 [Candidatus Altiarchaeales archaeon IMC4]
MQKLEFLAKYPFTNAAKDYVKKLGLSLDEIEGHPIYSASIETGRQRVAGAQANLDDKLSMDLEILGYAVGRILVNLTGDRVLIANYAKSEAENARMFMEQNPADFEGVAHDLGFEIRGKIYLADYLSYSAGLKQDKWRLVNRKIENGFVEVKKEDLPLLLGEAIRNRVAEPVKTEGIPKKLREIANQLKPAREQDIKVGKLNKKAIPPCISGMLASLGSGSASHNVMFILATFFTNLGLDTEQIVELFSVSPKFDAEKTRYQLSFLSGERGGTKYTCPTCATIKSYGLCATDCGVKHPLSYYRKNYRK